MSRKLNQIGKVFGRLTVIKEADGFKCVHYLCKCTCGKEKVIKSARLSQKTNPTRSCGCISRETTMRVKTIYPNKRALNRTYNVYKYNAKRVSRAFDLTHEQFEEITQKPCTYCGAEPSNRCSPITGTQEDFIYNGIDRVDNEIGYLYSNCVPCCSVCNFIKKNFSVCEFLGHIEKIYAHCIDKIKAEAV